MAASFNRREKKVTIAKRTAQQPYCFLNGHKNKKTDTSRFFVIMSILYEWYVYLTTAAGSENDERYEKLCRLGTATSVHFYQ